mmetsp:Transcript_24946/g.28740  ORF Transcript_24946/g.28740 Transcript_24946/m.28740 type:complete len:324 (+) Transcript_24946:81-1052(+)
MSSVWTLRGVCRDISSLGCKLWCSIALTVVIVICIVVPSSLQKLSPTEVGLSYDVIWKKLGSEVLMEGLNTKPTFGTIIKYPDRLIQVNFGSDSTFDGIDCNSRDGIQIDISTSFNYKIDTSKIYEMTKTYKNYDQFSDVITSLSRSAVRHACSRYTAIEFQTERIRVQQTMTEIVSSSMSYLKVTIEDLQLKNIDRPEAFQIAVQGKETARTDIELAEAEREQKILEVEATLARSEQTAQEMIDTANTQANATLIEAFTRATAVTEMIDAYADTFLTAKETFKMEDPKEILIWFENRIFDANPKNLVIDFPSKIGYREQEMT